jgi:hypothetical protein
VDDEDDLDFITETPTWLVRRRFPRRAVPVDRALRDPSQVAPFLTDPFESLGDPEAALEAGAVREEEDDGTFRSLIARFD